MKCDAVELRKESEDKNKSIIEIKIKLVSIPFIISLISHAHWLD